MLSSSSYGIEYFIKFVISQKKFMLVLRKYILCSFVLLFAIYSSPPPIIPPTIQSHLKVPLRIKSGVCDGSNKDIRSRGRHSATLRVMIRILHSSSFTSPDPPRQSGGVGSCLAAGSPRCCSERTCRHAAPLAEVSEDVQYLHRDVTPSVSVPRRLNNEVTADLDNISNIFIFG